MKKAILIFLSIITLSAGAQTTLRTADKAEYENYLKYCNTIIIKEVTKFSKITLRKVNGQYTDSLGKWYAIEPIKIYTYKTGITSITVQPNEQQFGIKLKLPVRQRQPTIKDFYENWQTKKIP